MPSSKNSLRTPKKKLPAKKRWKAAPSKRSAISATKSRRAKAPVPQVLDLLEQHYPDAHCELHHETPFQLLIATVLSAQCTDALVNKVTPALFRRFPDAKRLAKGAPEEIEKLVSSVNLFRTKAKNIKKLAEVLMEKHGGEVPPRLEDLVELAGVGRKTANVVLGNAFQIPSGIVVDTHVGRLSARFGWTQSANAVQIEKDLQVFVPKDRWVRFSHELIFHGRRVCKARNPACSDCFLEDICPRLGVEDTVP